MSEIKTGNLNLLEDKDSITVEEYLETYKSKINQDSERLFVREFLYPLLGPEKIKFVIPQYPFLDSAGRNRRIDFAIKTEDEKIALEVDGETYHAEGIVKSVDFDDGLQRQNEMLLNGWHLLRFSYSQLQDPAWRDRLNFTLRHYIDKNIPGLLSEFKIPPNDIQVKALEALELYRGKGWKKGIVVMPTGTGKTYLSAFDSKRFGGRVLFIVHRLDILSQSKNAFEKVWSGVSTGLLTGDIKENVNNSRVLFASVSTLRKYVLESKFKPTEFDYVIIDEVHHGQAPSYREFLKFFKPKFMIGMTGTPDRMDRKNVFELFDYNKIFEYSINDAIEFGYLVPYYYIGLKDNTDYSKIRHDGQKYNVSDLDKYLIHKERNESILKAYLEKGNGDKAIGFCVSIKHAKRMAEFFNKHGVSALAITSESEERKAEIKKFRDNKISIAFTVGLFNEGVDFPNVRVLLFLRPTESKTVFQQQLGRGLRLHPDKEKVIILDFIANYKRANNIRKYLSSSSSTKINPETGRTEKIEYKYSSGCKVEFDEEVEEILDNQDKQDLSITKEDLVAAYHDLAEELGRKPTQDEINSQGEFKIVKYTNEFGSWIKFLRYIKEFTEASYHYPQGVHLGHVFYILKILGTKKRKGSHIDEKYVRIRGGLAAGRLGVFQRQIKYKLQASMEFGWVVDDRNFASDEEYELTLTPVGKEMFDKLKPLLTKLNLKYKPSSNSIPSTDMIENTSVFHEKLLNFIKSSKNKNFIQQQFLKIHAVSQMLNYLYRVERKENILRKSIYQGFFRAPFVSKFCDQNGIEVATDTGAEHRCPFLLNILEGIGILEQTRNEITLKKFVISAETFQLEEKETKQEIDNRIQKYEQYVKDKKIEFESVELSKLKETFGKDMLTQSFYLKDHEFL